MAMGYLSTFITVANECPAKAAVAPARGGDQPALTSIEFELLTAHPYQFDQDGLDYEAHKRLQALKGEAPQSADRFFSSARRCLRSSDLVRRYGWGVHFTAQGKIALTARESLAYDMLSRGSESLRVLPPIAA